LDGYWRVTAPNGRVAILRQTDIGPAPWTGRKVDITYSALGEFGYNESNFPTDSTVHAEYLGKSLPQGSQLGPVASGAASAETANPARPGGPPASSDVAAAAPDQLAPAGGGTQGAGGGAAAALAWAHSMLGRLPESSGENEGPALNRFEGDFGFHGAPWCGIFVGHVLEKAGLKVPDSIASVAAILEMARNGEGPFEKGILPVGAIRAGDLVTFGGTEHVALVIGVDGKGIHTIAGNYENNVTEHTYSPGEVTGVVRPKYPASAPEALPGASPAGAAEVAAAPPAPPPPAGGSGELAFRARSAAAASVQHTVKFLAAVPSPEPAAQDQVAAGTSAAQSESGAPSPSQADVAPAGSAAAPSGAAVPDGIGAAGAISYPGDNAPQPQIAQWMASVAEAHGLPRELPVMAALVESSLHNDPGGDRDSVGYFQMRTSIWDNGAYAGYTHDPALQLKWFIDHALEARNQARASDPAFGTDPAHYGEWVADVERPAEEYRGRYQLRLEEARRLLSGG
jgi:hypothetical protein